MGFLLALLPTLHSHYSVARVLHSCGKAQLSQLLFYREYFAGNSHSFWVGFCVGLLPVNALQAIDSVSRLLYWPYSGRLGVAPLIYWHCPLKCAPRLHRVQMMRKEGGQHGRGKARATANHCWQALPEPGAMHQLKARKRQLETKRIILRFGRVGPPAMARPTAGSGFGECLSSGFDPPITRIPPGFVGEIVFFFIVSFARAHRSRAQPSSSYGCALGRGWARLRWRSARSFSPVGGIFFRGGCPSSGKRRHGAVGRDGGVLGWRGDAAGRRQLVTGRKLVGGGGALARMAGGVSADARAGVDVRPPQRGAAEAGGRHRGGGGAARRRHPPSEDRGGGVGLDHGHAPRGGRAWRRRPPPGRRRRGGEALWRRPSRWRDAAPPPSASFWR